MRAFAVACSLLLCLNVSHAQSALPPFPPPEKVIKSDREFNAVRFGPGNTFSVQQAPPDFQLEAFDFSADDNLLFTEWGSGRLETRDLASGKKTAQSKPVSGPIFETVDNSVGRQLVVVTQHGVIRFVDPKSGRLGREIDVEKGRFNYDIQKVVLAPDGSWLAYVNQDNGKVLDLRSDPPKVLADLEDGYDIGLSHDQGFLWVVDRTKLFGFRVGTWNASGSTPLLDEVRPVDTPALAVLSGKDGPVAFVPSKSGLLEFDLTTLKGSKVTDTPTYWVAADSMQNQLFVHEFKVSALYGADGTARCRWQIHAGQDFKVSPSGRWLADKNLDGAVELWSTESLTRACSGLLR
jgi:WD40 repeat protein